MSKRSNEIPPIRGTPGLGKETANDPAIVWTGGRVKPPGVSKTSKPPGAPKGSKTSKGKKRPTPQTKLTLKGAALEALHELMELYGQSASTAAGQALVEFLSIAKKRLQ